MSNSVAEAYLLIVRESNVPIFGEAVPIPFTGQIELDSWSWNIKNDEANLRNEAAVKKKEAEAAKKAGKPLAAKTTASKSKTPPIKPDDLIRNVVAMQNNRQVGQPDRDKKVLDMVKKAVKGYFDAASGTDEDDDKDKDKLDKMTLSFEKGADLATTPLLYALARGDLIPRAILTVFNRSKNSPVTLAITMGNVRLTKYDVSCDADATMSDVKEKWEATYETVNWVYQNRPAAAGLGLGTNLTQGQARVFAMKQKLLPF